MKHFLIGMLGLALAACGQTPTGDGGAGTPETAPVETPEETSPGEDAVVQPELDPLDRMGDACGMAPFRRYLGQAASDIPEDELPPRARIVGPDTQVTMDYAPRRLNILTDEAGTVIGFKCG
mgnify:CR=1 FL=1